MNLSNNSIINVIDCKDQIISPGFIDIQLNGAYGVDFSCVADLSSRDLSVEDVLDVAEKLTSTGVTSFCPTMVSSSRETYRRVIPLMRKAREQQYKLSKGEQKSKGAKILGMHLEGPFFASSKRGAHDGRHIFAPSKGMASVNEAYGLSNSNNGRLEDIDIITLAPELDGALDAIKSLTANQDNGHSVVISCGHTEATYEDGIQAVKSGATLLTHLYNAMNSFHHRTPGLVGLLSSELKLGRAGFERPYYSMIVDGIHVHESAVCMAYNSHPSGK
jgi:N-acetylglucosamine-6-phosphate deacetylase